MRRIAILIGLGLGLGLGLGCSGSKPVLPTPEAIDRALAAAGTFLAGQQRPDGSIASATYSALADGRAVTPLAALALRVTPARDAYTRAVGFVAAFDPDAVTGEPLAYPVYTYAIGALVLGAPENIDVHRARRDQLLAALRARQLPDGGWGYDPQTSIPRGQTPAPPAEPVGSPPPTTPLRSSNLSTTLLAVGALTLAGTPATDPALVKARGFVARCHNADGGFIFAPDNPDANKAGPAAAGGYRSYGSMTADGVRALLRLGAPLDDPTVTSAVAWLRRELDPTKNPGDFVPVNELRRASSYYYWMWTAAHALEHVARDDRRWAEALASELLRRRGADGSWRNPASEMREDDPVIATSFAVAALAICRGVITGERPAHAGWR